MLTVSSRDLGTDFESVLPQALPGVLFDYGVFQSLWQRAGLIQVGPHLSEGSGCVQVHGLGIQALQAALMRAGLPPRDVLLHYTDPFLLRAQPLRGLRHWCGPRLLVCGDLHHGERPLEVLAAYQGAEPHDAVLLSFNPALLPAVRQRLQVPVRALPPSFFCYPAAVRVDQLRHVLLHVGSLWPQHARRHELVLAFQARGRLPFRPATMASPEEAATLYAEHAPVLNVPLNHDLNHRFFQVMASGPPLVVFGDPGLVGEHRHLAVRSDVFWASIIEELEGLAAPQS